MSNQHGGNGGVIGLIILIAIGIWLGSTLLKPDKWQGMYEVPESNAIGTVSFENREACERWLDQQRVSPTPERAYGFECGSNCEPPKTDIGFYKCKETFD